MPRQSPRKRTTVVEKTEVKTEVAAPRKGSKGGQKTTTTKRKIKAVIEDEEDEEAEEVKAKVTETATTKQTDAKPAKKRKTASTKKSKPEDAMPLAERTAISSLKKAMYIGAHVSAAGGVQNALTNATHIGANAFALFLKSQRKWDNPPLAAEAIAGFRAGTAGKVGEAGNGGGAFDTHRHCVPHGSYLVNLAAEEPARAAQALGAFVDDLRRCAALGISLYNFHPGNTNGAPRAEAIGRIAAQLNAAHAAEGTGKTVAVLENMAGQGNVVGSSWEDLRDIIALVDDKERVGVCIDTCHAFAAGYDLRTPEAFKKTMDKFEEVVGRKYLRAFHINDSKAPLSSHRDLHANIGTGFLGLRAFHSVVNCEHFVGLPMVLETPIDRKGPDGKSVEDKQIWADEIKLLESLIGMDPESDEFKALDEKLQAQGEAERKKLQDQVDRKTEKDAKKGAKGKAKRGKKKKDDSDEASESE